jgi:hypothetical protein
VKIFGFAAQLKPFLVTASGQVQFKAFDNDGLMFVPVLKF